jgi:rubrerythrin
MIDYCGFLELEDARRARDRLRAESVRADIVIREAPDSDLSGPAREEYWLRVERQRYRDAAALLESDEAATVEHEEEPGGEDDSFSCGDCGHLVAADERFCPSCGARFEDD